MKNIQYYHEMILSQKFTVAVDLTTVYRHSLEKASFEWTKPFELKIGFTRCSPKDQYNKKLGRIESCAKMKLTSILYKHDIVTSDINKKILTFELQEPVFENYKLRICFTINKKSDRIRFVEAYLT